MQEDDRVGAEDETSWFLETAVSRPDQWWPVSQPVSCSSAVTAAVNLSWRLEGRQESNDIALDS